MGTSSEVQDAQNAMGPTPLQYMAKKMMPKFAQQVAPGHVIVQRNLMDAAQSIAQGQQQLQNLQASKRPFKQTKKLRKRPPASKIRPNSYKLTALLTKRAMKPKKVKINKKRSKKKMKVRV